MSKDITTPTLSDVARMAGVSTATVSRSLNTSDKVSEETRSRVLRAVETLGYVPNFGARAMAAKRTYTIGAIIPTMENAIFARGLQAFQERLHERGYTLLVSSTGYDPAREAEQVRALVARGADGLMLIGYARAPDIYDYLARREIPVLVSWAHRAGASETSIGFDNRAAMRQLAETVLARGHRDIAVISGITEGNDRAAERLAGIREVLEGAGLEPGPIVEVPYGVQTGSKAFAEVMAAPRRPTAVMCINDVLAVGAILRARTMGFDVPGDVSITGFDDIELAQIVSPALTTVHVPHRRMGRMAADELVRMVEGESTGVSARLDSALRLRESLAMPAP